MAKGKRKPEYREYVAARRAVAKDLPPVVVLEGDAFLRGEALAALTTALHKKMPGIEEILFHGPASANEPNLPLEEVLAELKSSSLFASEKVVQIRRADRVLFPASNPSDGRGRSPHDALTEWIKAPGEGTWLVIGVEKLNRQRTLGKTLAKAALVPCPALEKQREVEPWLRDRAERLHKSLETGVTDLLHTSHGGNLGALAAELEKLSIYVGDNPTIAIADVEAFLSGSVEYNVFGLTNAIEAGDLHGAMDFARLIIGQGARAGGGKKLDAVGSAHMTLHRIATTLENLLRTCAHAEDGGGEPLHTVLGCSPWRAESLSRAARSCSIVSLRPAISEVAEAIRASHDTGGDACLSLERAVIAACRAFH